jgi:hypothetical protein
MMTGCSPDPFQSEYAAVQKDAVTHDPWSALVALDQKFPNRLALKIDLGARSWAAGNFQQAEAYWARGETLAGTAGDALDAVLWADLAQAALVRGDTAKAVGYADRAVRFKDEKLGAILTRAKAHLARNEDKQALEDFKTGWETKRQTMTAADYGSYARALVADKNYALAFEVLENYRENRPYEPGTGLVESACLENLGRYDESVLAALVDVDYQRSRGLIASEQVIQNLKTLETKIASRGLPPEKSGLTTVRAATAWVQGDYKKVDFDNNLLAASVDARFFRLNAQLRSGRVGDADLKAYANLEARFHDFPSYYLGLISYFRDTRKDYKNEGFAALAERLVNLASSGPFAAEGRSAMALAWSVPSDQAPLLLTRTEIDRALPGDPKMVKLLATSDNPSVQYAVVRHQQWAAASAEFRSLLTSLEASSSGRVKERLNLVLQSR